jgi:hypothetical protein
MSHLKCSNVHVSVFSLWMYTSLAIYFLEAKYYKLQAYIPDFDNGIGFNPVVN